VLLTRGADGEHALDKPAAGLALRTETALAPEHGGPQRPFGRIVGRLDALHVEKRPQRIPARHEIRAETPQGVFLVSPWFDPFPHRLLDGLNHAPHRATIQLAIPEAGPDHEHLLGQGQQRGGIGLPGAAGLGPPPQVTHQMCPAQLPTRRVQAVVGAQAVRGDPPDKAGPQQGVQLLLPAPVLEQKQRRHRADRHPQPGLPRPLVPTGLIDVDMVGLRDRRLHFFLGGGERGTGHLLELGHAADADRQQPDHLEQPDQFAVADAVAPVEQGDQRDHPWPKRPRWDVVGAGGVHPGLAARAADAVVLIFGNLRLHRRDLPDLLPAWWANRRQVGREVVLAAGAAGRAQRHHVGDLLHGQELALLVGMAGLRPFGLGLATGCFACCWRCRGRIGGGRLGGVLRGLVEPGLQGRELRDEQGQKLAHLGWGRLPGFLAQFGWALWLIHCGSMPDHAISGNPEDRPSALPERLPRLLECTG